MRENAAVDKHAQEVVKHCTEANTFITRILKVKVLTMVGSTLVELPTADRNPVEKCHSTSDEQYYSMH